VAAFHLFCVLRALFSVAVLLKTKRHEFYNSVGIPE
jgi:hypothetical protein